MSAAIVIGTQSLRGDKCRDAVARALSLGYRRIDTAIQYGNEAAIADAIDASGVPRADVFVTTKIGPAEMARGAQGVAAGVVSSMSRLRVSYLDAVLLHWPGASGLLVGDPRNAALRREAWQALVALKASGAVRQIGVCNFLPVHLDAMLRSPRTDGDVARDDGVDAVQLELHPWCRQRDVVAWCAAHRVARIEAYGALGGGRLVSRVINAVGPLHPTSAGVIGDGDVCNADHADTDEVDAEDDAAALLLEWCVDEGYVPVVRASSCEHMRRNLAAVTMPRRTARRERHDCFSSLAGADDEHLYWFANLLA